MNTSATSAYNINHAQYFQNCWSVRYIDMLNSKHNITANTSINRKDPVPLSDGEDGYQGNGLTGVPWTAVIYLPEGTGKLRNMDEKNIVYTDNDRLVCDYYYSEDKVDIEIPHNFFTNKAEYKRTMSREYGTAILPYAFRSNANVQAYILREEHSEVMRLQSTDEVPANTPFVFKNKNYDGSSQTVDFTMTDENGNFGIEVFATIDNSDKSETDHNPKRTGEDYFEDASQMVTLGGWTARGYYVTQTIQSDDNTFSIIGDEFWKTKGTLNILPHRITFHGTWEKGTPSPTGDGAKGISTGDDLSTAIEAADLEQAMRSAEAVYDAAGRRLSAPQPGLNIVRYNDGTTKKVMIK